MLNDKIFQIEFFFFFFIPLKLSTKRSSFSLFSSFLWWHKRITASKLRWERRFRFLENLTSMTNSFQLHFLRFLTCLTKIISFSERLSYVWNAWCVSAFDFLNVVLRIMRHFHTFDIFLNEPNKRLPTARKVKLNAVLCRYPSDNGIVDVAPVVISAKKPRDKSGFQDYLYVFISIFTRN